MSNEQLPIHSMLSDLNIIRLQSRNPSMKKAKVLVDANFTVVDSWRAECLISNDLINVFDINDKSEEFNLPRKVWSCLDRIRTKHGGCADMMHKYVLTAFPSCDCGAERQTVLN